MKKNGRNKNVIAPEQKVKSITELAADFIKEVGFRMYGLCNGWEVFEKTIAEANNNSLYFFIKETTLCAYQGFKDDREIRARKLYTCSVFELEEVCGMLNEQNYL